MFETLNWGLHHKSGIVRKACALALQAPKRLIGLRTRYPEDLAIRPPILVNSLPKSGTHLLEQIVGSIPELRNFGEFISSMKSSFHFRRQSLDQCRRLLATTTPGELVRAHLFHSDEIATLLGEMHFVHFFIYRDLRDVVVSEAIYYRRINRWHRLHSVFRDARSDNDAIMLAITGFDDSTGAIYFPNIGVRFAHYAPWIASPGVHAVRFESLVSAEREESLRKLMEFHASRQTETVNVENLCAGAVAAIAPQRSHTYRSGKSGGWKDVFTEHHKNAFKEVAGHFLTSLGYEVDDSW